MGGFSGEKFFDRLARPRKTSGLLQREDMKQKDDKNVSCCSRIGCSANVASTKGTRIGSMDNNNTKIGRPLVSSSTNGKEVVRSSSRTSDRFGYLKNLAKSTVRRRPSSNLETVSSETSSFLDDPAASEPTLPRQKIKRGTISSPSQSSVSREAIVTKAGSSSRGASKNSDKKSELGTRDAPTGPSVSSDNSESTVRGGVSRYRLRSNSVSDVLPNNSARKVSVVKNKNTDGESSSSSKVNKTTNLLVPKGRKQITSQVNDITVSDNTRNRKLPTTRDNSIVSSSDSESGYLRRSERLRAIASSPSSQLTSRLARTTDPNPSFSISQSNSYSSMMPSSPSEADTSPSLVNRDSLNRGMNEIAEVLLELGRIDYDEEITYEQLASLETNLFTSGMFRFYDQHRDMRLDIDNMSYEELLALGDKIGTVSTALSEEALSKSLKKSIYHQKKDETSAMSLNKNDDNKCSICQEEYDDGDEIGTMPCQHMYHVNCVEQWLRMKNWCPICKTSAKEEKSF